MRQSFKTGLSYLLAIFLVADPNVFQNWSIRGRQTNGSAQATESGRQANGRSDVAAQDSKTKDLAPLIKKLQALADPKKLPERLDLLEKAAKGGSRAGFDVKAKAKELGSGIDKIFSFVRDEVRYEAYEGVLRGPRGTLMALAGNSFDKSLLLAELLKEHGVAVRFVRGRLDGERAETLITQMFEAVKLKKKPAVAKKEDATVPPKEIAEASDAIVNLNIARWLQGVEAVGGTLKRANLAISNQPPVPKKALLAEAADHLWIEFKQGEAWTAFDPSFKDAKPGKTYATKTKSLESVPLTVHHKVTIQLKLEERFAAGLKTRDLLKHDATAADLNGAAITLRHAVSATKSDWTATPVLRIEEKEFRGQKISGPVGGFAGGVAKLGRTLFKKRGDRSLEKGITAMWLDFEFVYPSGKKETVRREVFDRIGLVARNEKRQASAPLTPLPSFGMPYPMTGAFALSFSSSTLHPGLSLRRFSAHMPTLRAVLPGSGNKKPPEEEMQRLFTSTLSVMAESFHLSSKANIAATRTAGIWGDVSFYEATPRLAIVSAVPASHGKNAVVDMSLDLRRNDLRAVADKALGAAIVWANITRGILDGALEHVLFVDALRPSGSALNQLSTVSIFEKARAASLGAKAVIDPKDFSKLKVPVDAKARLNAGWSKDVAVIVPEKGFVLDNKERLGWWRVDLKSGETVGVVDTGLHQSGTMYVLAGQLIQVAIMGTALAVFLAYLHGEINYDQGYMDGYRKAMADRKAYEELTGYVPPTRDQPGRAPNR